MIQLLKRAFRRKAAKATGASNIADLKAAAVAASKRAAEARAAPMPTVGQALADWHRKNGIDIDDPLFVTSVDHAFTNELRRVQDRQREALA